MKSEMLKILLVDDHAPDRENLEEMILRAKDFSAAMEHADRLSSCFKRIDQGGIDLVILDLFLPETKGIETLRRVHKRAPHLPLVALTRFDDEATGREAVREGAQDYLVKGEFDERLLHHAVRYAIERKKNEMELQDYAKQLEISNEEYRRFAYVVSHDLRSPLRAMQGFAIALEEDYGDKLDETGREYARRIVKASLRMDDLIQDLLAYSRLTSVDMELAPVSLEECVDKALESLEALVLEKGARVELERPFPKIVGHPATLVQIIVNLMTNGIKFVGPGVTPHLRIRSEKKGRSVRLWISDNGIGIDPENHQRIFQVFERLHGTGEYAGTGIGLAIVSKGIQRLGGKVGVEPREGGGSRFWIDFVTGA